MRRILIDHARGHLRAKRAGGAIPVPLDEALIFSPEQSLELGACRRENVSRAQTGRTHSFDRGVWSPSQNWPVRRQLFIPGGNFNCR